MAAGDLLTANWQVELRTTLMGSTTNYPIRGLDGVSTVVPIVRKDVPKLLVDGVFQGTHTYGSRVITVTMDVVVTTAANLETRMATLETAWAKATSDIFLCVQLGGVKKRCSGRVVEFDRPPLNPTEAVTFRCIGVRAQFEAGDPTWTTI